MRSNSIVGSSREQLLSTYHHPSTKTEAEDGELFEKDLDFKTLNAGEESSLRDKKAGHCIKEILSTETMYINNLKLLLKIYLEPLEMADTTLKKKVIALPEIAIIISILKQIITVNTILLRDVKTEVVNLGLGEAKIGYVFNSFAPLFKLYGQYASNHSSAAETFNTLLEHEKAWKPYLDSSKESWIKLHPGTPIPSLESCLIMPVQRVPRYELLLKELTKSTQMEHADYPFLVAAMDEIHEASIFINETIRKRDNQIKLKSIEQQFAGKSVELIKGDRYLIKEGGLIKVSRKSHIPYHFHLFNDMLLYSEDTKLGYKLHKTITLEACRVEDLPDEPAGGLQNAFKILSLEKSFIVIAESSTVKDSWLTSLNSILSNGTGGGRRGSVSAPIWKPDQKKESCTLCNVKFTMFNRRHHCRHCGEVFCGNCSRKERKLPHSGEAPVRVCNTCCDAYDIEEKSSIRTSITLLKCTMIKKTIAKVQCTIESSGSLIGSTKFDYPYNSKGEENSSVIFNDTIIWQTNFKEEINPSITFNLYTVNELKDKEITPMGIACIPFTMLESKGINSDTSLQVIGILELGSEELVATLEIRVALLSGLIFSEIEDPTALLSSYKDTFLSSKSPLIAAAIVDSYEVLLKRKEGANALKEDVLISLQGAYSSFKDYIASESFSLFINNNRRLSSSVGITINRLDDSIPISPRRKGLVGRRTSNLFDKNEKQLGIVFQALKKPNTPRGILIKKILDDEVKYVHHLVCLADVYVYELEEIAQGASLNLFLTKQEHNVDTSKSNLVRKTSTTLSFGFDIKSSQNDATAQAILQKASCQVFFESVKQIFTLNSKLLDDLYECAFKNGFDEMSVGSIFSDFAPLFELYGQYCSVLDEVISHMKNEVFAKLLDDLSRSKFSKGNLLEMLIDQPTIRILAYQSDLKSLQQITPIDHSDFTKVQSGVIKIEHSSQKIASVMEKYKQSKILRAIESEISGVESLISVPNRRFILKGLALKLGRKSPKQYMFYLFSDILMYCTSVSENKSRHNRTIELQDVSLIDNKEANRGHDYTITICSPGKSITIALEKLEEKQNWYDLINDACSETRNIRGITSVNDVAPVWAGDETQSNCSLCDNAFTTFLVRRHHCRKCGRLVCGKCSNHSVIITHIDEKRPVRACDVCAKELNIGGNVTAPISSSLEHMSEIKDDSEDEA